MSPNTKDNTDTGISNITEFVSEIVVKSFDFFNDELFEGKLPDTYITIHDCNKAPRSSGVAGRFKYKDIHSMSEGEKHTIELDSAYTGMCVSTNQLDLLLSTLVHEMVHEWDFIYNFNQVTHGGHGPTWRKKMTELGLEPFRRGRQWKADNTSHKIIKHGLTSRILETYPQELRDSFPQFKYQKPEVTIKPKKVYDKWFNYKCPTCGRVQKKRETDGIALCMGTLHDMHEVTAYLHSGKVING